MVSALRVSSTHHVGVCSQSNYPKEPPLVASGKTLVNHTFQIEKGAARLATTATSQSRQKSTKQLYDRSCDVLIINFLATSADAPCIRAGQNIGRLGGAASESYGYLQRRASGHGHTQKFFSRLRCTRRGRTDGERPTCWPAGCLRAALDSSSSAS